MPFLNGISPFWNFSHAPLSIWTLQISFHQILLTAYGAPRFDSWSKHPLKCHAGYNTIWIHSALCPLFTLSIRVLHSNAGHIQKKVTCYVPLSSSTGTYRQKVICYVPLSSNTGTYSGKVSCYVPLSISTGTYRQKIIYDVPLVLSCGTYKTIFSIYVPTI